MNYLMALFGALLYNYAMFVMAKNDCDKVEMDFPYSKYFKKNVDNWGLTVLVAPVLVWYLPDIISLLNERWSLGLVGYQIYYLAAGPITEVLLILLMMLIGWKNSFVAKVHKD